MKKSHFEVDMTKGSLYKNVLRFAIPFMLSSFIQLFYNAADLVVVSRYTGSDAMASVGATSPLNNLLTNFFIGISIGASVIISRRFGAHDSQGVHKAVHTAILTGLVLGALCFTLGQVACKPLLMLTGTPQGDVLNGAVLYMRIIFAGAPASLLYNFCAAVLRAVGDTKRPLYILAFSGLLNVILNLVFVIFFDMGVAGVALATIIAQYLSATIAVIALIYADTDYKLIIKSLRIYKKEFGEMLKIGVPAGLQNITLSFSNTIIQSSVNSFGAAAMAGNAAAANIEGFAFAFKDALRNATMTSVSQNYGARDVARIKKSVGVCFLYTAVGASFLGVLMAIFSKQLLGIYITDSPKAMEYGVIRIMVSSLPYVLSGVMDIFSGYLRGLGYSSTSTLNSFVGICGLRILWVFAIFPFTKTFASLYLCWPVSWVLVIIFNTTSLHFVKKKAFAKLNQSAT